MSEENVQDAQENAQSAQENGPEDKGRDAGETVPRAEVDKLYCEMKRWKEKCRKAESGLEGAGAKDAEIERLTGTLSKLKVDGALVAAAREKRAIDPEEVAALLKAQVRLSDELEPTVVEADGTQRFGAEAEPMTIGELVGEYLAAHPHHVKPTGTTGGGTSARTEGTEGAAERIAKAATFEELEGIIASE
jgi:hypothetical protein